jgi:hypothetical protein
MTKAQYNVHQTPQLFSKSDKKSDLVNRGEYVAFTVINLS